MPDYSETTRHFYKSLRETKTPFAIRRDKCMGEAITPIDLMALEDLYRESSPVAICPCCDMPTNIPTAETHWRGIVCRKCYP